MNKAISEFLVGLTVLLGLVGVAALLLLFGEFTGAGARYYRVTLHVLDASGLSTASNVTVNGVAAGAIETIRPDADPRGGVKIGLRINDGVRIPRDVSVTLERGLVGEAALAMRAKPLPPGSPDPGYLQPDETLSVQATGMLDEIGAMFDSRLSSFTKAADEIAELSRSLKAAGENLSEALAPRTVAEVDAGSARPNLSSTVARIDAAVADARLWLGDETLRTDAKAAAGRLTALFDQAQKAVDSWSEAAKTVATNADRLGGEGAKTLQEFAAASRSLDETIREVQGVVAKVNQGEGSAGMLVNNPDLYRSITDAAVRLEKALTEAQLLFEKYRKEGVPIRF